MRPKLPECRPLTPKEQKWVMKNKGLAYTQTWKMAWACAYRFHYSHQRTYAKQYFKELFPAAMIGMCVGIQRYKKNKGASRATYVFIWIRCCLQRAKYDSVTRVGARRNPHRMCLFSEMTHRNDDSSQEFEIWDSRGQEDEVVDEPELTPELNILMSLALDDERWIRIIKARVFDDRTLESIGDEEGVSKERIRQIEEKAFRRLRASSGFMQALEKQRDRHRMHINADDFFGMSIGILPQPRCPLHIKEKV